ncbi:MAG: hypothetical protein EPO24_07605 [Bacteroidetes bacterium]|nr:MAG: hypothetical protein EPO24_07605 [Bacteroidota bacterium]
MKNKNREIVPVNFGKLLEDQLTKWRGGGRHASGIAEYITNSDDSYRRQQKFKNELIQVEIYSKYGRRIDKLVISDRAEGMSFDDLENKFFLYFESKSGREQGEQVTGKFGTGGKAYAIMNFKSCWITSIRDGYKSRAWFKWDSEAKEIIKGYNKGGYKEKRTKESNGTVVELETSIKNNYELLDLVAYLEKLPRIRHVLKDQQVMVRIKKKKDGGEFPMRYTPPLNPIKEWTFPVPKELRNSEVENPILYLRYFQKLSDDDSFIDVNDGISSVADLKVKNYDGRPFSKYFNGSLTLSKLKDSSAVKENRKGLEEGDDLTDSIEKFIKECVTKVVNEVEEEQRRKERERRLSASNEKMRELSKFLKKCDLKFRLELKELKKRVIPFSEQTSGDEEDDAIDIYRKPIEGDPEELLIRGKWIKIPVSGKPESGGGELKATVPRFIPDPLGTEFAVIIGARKVISREVKKVKQGLQVLLSDDMNYAESERPVYSEYDDPVSDREMVTKGIIWINANHPLIVKVREKSDNDPVFLEMVANYTLMVVSQHQAQKQYDAEPDDEKSDPILLFRQKFFALQRELREDYEISYFEKET